MTNNLVASGQATHAGSWIVCTDPHSEQIYYYNRVTLTSSWEKPPELDLDLSKPPPPPMKSGARQVRKTTDAWDVPEIGRWEEVKPGESKFSGFAGVEDSESSGGDQAVISEEERTLIHPVIKLKYEALDKYRQMDDENELFEKKPFEKKSSTHNTAGECSFRSVRQFQGHACKRVAEPDD